MQFPFLLGRAFIEARSTWRQDFGGEGFPYSFVGTFIEVLSPDERRCTCRCISLRFCGGLSLRRRLHRRQRIRMAFISLPFRRDFHQGYDAFTGALGDYADFLSFLEGLSLRLVTDFTVFCAQSIFSSFPEGRSLRLCEQGRHGVLGGGFPFLFGRAFIEALAFPVDASRITSFPFLSGRAFIEVALAVCSSIRRFRFLRFLEETFIEATSTSTTGWYSAVFLRFLAETFIEETRIAMRKSLKKSISLPFWRGFH